MKEDQYCDICLVSLVERRSFLTNYKSLDTNSGRIVQKPMRIF